jgi:hypothetical protein
MLHKVPGENKRLKRLQREVHNEHVIVRIITLLKKIFWTKVQKRRRGKEDLCNECKVGDCVRVPKSIRKSCIQYLILFQARKSLV